MALVASKSATLDGPTHSAGPVFKRMRYTYNQSVTLKVGEAVCLDFTAADVAAYGYMRCVDIADGNVTAKASVCGICTDLLDSAGLEGWIEVQVRGEYGPVSCDHALALNDPVIASNDPPGDVKIYVESGLNPPFAICTWTDPGAAGNTHPVFGAIADDEAVIYMYDIYNLSAIL